MFELKDHDGLGRLGLFSVNDKSIMTPNIAVVVNPNELSIPPSEMARDFGVDLIITNSYIINNSRHKESIVKQGIHEFLDFPGIIYTDSGTYQMFSKGGVSITNEETLAFQDRIGSDIHTPLDLFTLPSDERSTAEFKLKETIKRIKSVKSYNFTAPIQGGSFIDLRRSACRQLADVPATVYPIGGIVPYLINYDFKRLIKIIIACKEELPLNTPVHAFGAGHPLVFSLLAYAGIDLFDSASYALYARQGKYITETGTKKVRNLVSLPCDCPICSKNKPSDLLDESLLVRHNLHALMREVRLVRQAIQEDRLFDLVNSRARSHPSVYFAFKELLKHQELLIKQDPVRKRSALFWTGTICNHRPEISYALNRLSEIGFRKTPKPLKMVYPFGQSMGWVIDYSKKNYSDINSLRVMADYQLGKGAGELIPDEVIITRSSNQRLHQVFNGDDLLFVIRARDGYFSLHRAGAKLFRKYLKRVFVPEELAEFYLGGGDVFAKHVVKCDESIKPREEVGVFNGRKLLAIGEASLSGSEMLFFNRGVAVKVREAIL